MAIRFRLVRFILGIALLIVAVQVLTTLHFSSTHFSEDSFSSREHRLSRRKDKLDRQVPKEAASFAERTSKQSWTQGGIEPVDVSEDAPVKQPTTPPLTPFKPPCKLRHKDAISALKRAKTDECRHMIYNVACKGEAETLYVNEVERYCPVDRAKGSPARSPGDTKPAYGPPVRVVFVLTLHGRAVRQVKRLFKALYHKQHYFYFHIDSRSDLLRREVQAFTKDYPNTDIAPWSLSTIWGGASLLTMLLRCMEDLVTKKKDWKWDFFINLSESDFPIRTNDDLMSFLRSHREDNFLKPHGRDAARFIKKQGLDRTFLECEEHMWRLGDRKLPNDIIDIDGGSDWIALNHKFVTYLVTSQDKLVVPMKHLYTYALLPAESFFHTVLRNGPYCETFVRTNLRLTNWKRKLGCRCQYKHIVDWCGCSPNDFKPEDFNRIKTQTINYFARKFEAIVNQEIVHKVDTWLYGDYPTDTPGLTRYWENMYHYKDTIYKTSDTFFTFFYSFARLALAKANIGQKCRFHNVEKVLEVHYLNIGDNLSGMIPLFTSEFTDLLGTKGLAELETWAEPINKLELMNYNATDGPARLQGLLVGTGWDQKERVFRNFGKLMGPYDEPVLVHRWSHGTAFKVKIMWVDPINVVAGVYEMNVVENWVISFHKPTFRKPLRPGKWTIKMVYSYRGDDMVIGQTQFLVIPISIHNQQALTLKDAIAYNNGPPAGLYTSELTVDFDHEANDTEMLVQKSSENGRKVGSDLEAWIDELVSDFWTVNEVCSSTLNRYKCGRIPPCRATTWSSRSPDPKSELGAVKSNGRIR